MCVCVCVCVWVNKLLTLQTVNADILYFTSCLYSS